MRTGTGLSGAAFCMESSGEAQTEVRLRLRLIKICRDGTPAQPVAAVPADVLAGTAALYRRVGFQPPWVGYLAVDEDRCVGTCAFKSLPREGRVEIAYFTFPEFEGRGFASEMARLLIGIATRRGVTPYAQTLPAANASTRVLEKLGFEHVRSVQHPEDGLVWEWEPRANVGGRE